MRLTLRFTTEDEIDGHRKLQPIVDRLRNMSPLYENVRRRMNNIMKKDGSFMNPRNVGEIEDGSDRRGWKSKVRTS